MIGAVSSRAVAASLALALAAVSLHAQTNVGDLAPRAVGALSKYAQVCDRLGAHGSAAAARLELLAEYDADNKRVRTELERIGIGRTAPDSLAVATLCDDVKPADRTALERSWRELAIDLGKRHQQAAAEAVRAGDQAVAERHFRRVLRFCPDDATAGRALGREIVHGTWRTPMERDRFVRQRLLDEAATQLRSVDFPITEVPREELHPWLQMHLADAGYRGVRGPTTEVWGSVPAGTLRAALQVAERSNLFLRAILAGTQTGEWLADVAPVFVIDPDVKHHHRAVDASSYSAQTKESSKKNPQTVWLKHDGRRVLFLPYSQLPTIASQVANCTARAAAGITTDALDDGLARLIEVYLLGGSRFLPQPLRGPPASLAGTRDGVDQVLALPEVPGLRSLASVLAWLPDAPGVASLLCPPPGRTSGVADVQSLTLVHYLLLQDPALLAALDDAVSVGENVAQRAAAALEQSHAVTFEDLQEQWRHHWRHLAAASARIEPQRRPAAVEQRLANWVGEVSRWRVARGLPPLSSLPALSNAALTRLESGRATGVARDAGTPEAKTSLRRLVWDEPLVLPSAWSTKTGIATLLGVPACRDLLLAPSLAGLAHDVVADQAVVEVLAIPAGPTVRRPWAFPFGGERVPATVPVVSLGTAAKDFLAGRGFGEPMGGLLSLHFGPTAAGVALEVGCRVTGPAGAIDGELLAPTADVPRALRAPGMFVFCPRLALPTGVDLMAHWQWRNEAGEARELRLSFRVGGT